MREWEIGKIIKVKGELYEVCENDNPKGFSLCTDCAFAHVSCGTLGLGRCFGRTRTDRKNVIFKKVTKHIKDKKMNEKIDLTEILKNFPKGTKLYSPIVGEVTFAGMNNDSSYPINVYTLGEAKPLSFTKQGLFFRDMPNGECLLFPSKDQRGWSKFRVPVEKFDYSTLKPFDKVLVRFDNSCVWRCTLFSYKDDQSLVGDVKWSQGIPYNEDTKHLVGTTNMPDEKYIWWEES